MQQLRALLGAPLSAGRGSYTDASGAAALSRQPAVVTDELESYEALVEHAGGHCALLVFAA